MGWLQMYPAIPKSEYIEAFHLFRLLEKQKVTGQDSLT